MSMPGRLPSDIHAYVRQQASRGDFPISHARDQWQPIADSRTRCAVSHVFYGANLITVARVLMGTATRQSCPVEKAFVHHVANSLGVHRA